MDKIQTLFNNLSLVITKEVTEDTINNFSEELKSIIIEPAKATNMCKQIRINKKVQKKEPNKPWFNANCKESVKNYKILRKSIPKQNKILLKKLAKKHNNLLRKEKRKYDNENNEKLKLLKTSNPGAYWKIINQGKKQKKVGNIPSNSMFKHFQELNQNNSFERINTREKILHEEEAIYESYMVH